MSLQIAQPSDSGMCSTYKRIWWDGGSLSCQAPHKFCNSIWLLQAYYLIGMKLYRSTSWDLKRVCNKFEYKCWRWHPKVRIWRGLRLSSRVSTLGLPPSGSAAVRYNWTLWATKAMLSAAIRTLLLIATQSSTSSPVDRYNQYYYLPLDPSIVICRSRKKKESTDENEVTNIFYKDFTFQIERR